MPTMAGRGTLMLIRRGNNLGKQSYYMDRRRLHGAVTASKEGDGGRPKDGALAGADMRTTL